MPLQRTIRSQFISILPVFVCLVCFLHGTLSAQYRFDRWTTENGLPSNWTLGLQQTPDGYLWLITYGGLLRFDGLQFKSFNRANTPAIKSTNFAAFGLKVDHEGALWAATWQGGAIRYFQGAFTAYTTKEGLPNNHVVRIDEDSHGTVWIFTDPGLSMWKGGKITAVAPAPGSPFNPSLRAPPNLGLDPYLLGLWRFTSAGWQRFAYGQWSNVPMPPEITHPQRVRLDRLVEDTQHRIWFKIIGREHEIFGVDQGRLSIYKGVPKGSFACYQDHFGRLWITDPGGHTGLWKDGHFTALSGFSTASLFRVFEDKDREFWVGTLNEGLFRLAQQEVTMIHLPGGLAPNRIGSVLVDPAGDIWVGSQGITRIRNGLFRSFVRKHAPEKWFDAQSTSSMYLDKDGALWLGYYDQLVRFQNGKFRALSPALRSIDSEINVTLRDAAGDLWFGGQGLYHLHKADLHCYKTANGSAIAEIRELLEDPGGGIWIASDDGLLFFHEGQIKTWTESDGLSSNHISALHQDSEGVLWIGTADGGLNRFEQGRFQHITVQNGLYSDTIYRIFEDRAGFLWLTCRKGIFRVRKAELNAFAAGRISRVASLHLGTANGFRNVDCRGHGQPKGFQKEDGTLLLPTQDGLAVLHPDQITIDSRPPPVLIESCWLNRQAVNCQSEIRIQPGQAELEIQYTAISFSRAEQTRFQYQLSGLDMRWTEADTRRSVLYSHLPPGTYTFRVIAANSDGVWNTKGQSLSIVVLPPFYRTWWFLMLVSATVAGAAAFGHRHRMAQLHRRQAAQEAFSRQLIATQENERRRIASELHDSLGQRLVIIRNWALLGSGQIAAKRSAGEEFHQIDETALQAIHEVREIAYNLGPYHLDRIGLANTIQDMTDRVAQASGIRFRTEIEEIEGALSREAEMNLFRIAQEAINNLVKHSLASEAEVTVKRETNSVTLIVRDNGTGFDSSSLLTSTEKSGFGLTGMAERVHLLHGTWAIHSMPGHGTTIEVTLKTRTNPAQS